MSYRYIGLPPAPFEPLFTRDDAALAAGNIRRVTADATPGYPCRITLDDAEPGETLLLLNHEHHAADTPYRATGPIFVRESARASFDAIGAPPPALARRTLSLRAYDAAGMMLDADLVEGREADVLLARLFRDPAVAYVHAHYARRGCFAARVERG